MDLFYLVGFLVCASGFIVGVVRVGWRGVEMVLDLVTAIIKLFEVATMFGVLALFASGALACWRLMDLERLYADLSDGQVFANLEWADIAAATARAGEWTVDYLFK